MRFLGVEQVLTLDGRRYRLGRLTLSLLRRWTDWAVDQLEPLILPDPRPLSLEALEYFEELAATWKTLSNPHVKALYGTPDGRAEIWRLLFDKYHWRLDPLPLLDHCENLERVLNLASGVSATTILDVQREYLTSLGQLDTEDSEPVDWTEQFAALFANLYLRPHDIAEMTLPELVTVCRAKPNKETILTLALGYAKLSEAQKSDMSALLIRSLLR